MTIKTKLVLPIIFFIIALTILYNEANADESQQDEDQKQYSISTESYVESHGFGIGAGGYTYSYTVTSTTTCDSNGCTTYETTCGPDNTCKTIIKKDK